MRHAVLKAVVAPALALLLLAGRPAPASPEALLDPAGAGAVTPAIPVAIRAPARAMRQWYGMVTAYCSAGRTASGAWTYAGSAAAEYDVPMHSRLRVAGVGDVVVEDRGQAGLFAVDVFMPSCHAAIMFGRTRRLIQILES